VDLPDPVAEEVVEVTQSTPNVQYVASTKVSDFAEHLEPPELSLFAPVEGPRRIPILPETGFEEPADVDQRKANEVGKLYFSVVPAPARSNGTSTCWRISSPAG